MARIRSNSRVEGVKELCKQLERVEKIPKSVINKASNAGIKKPLRDARGKAPKDSGALKKGIIKIREKTKKRTAKKVVYRIVFDRSYNSIFQKYIIKPGTRGANPPKRSGYYPVSQEFGFHTSKNSRVPGLNFIHQAFKDNYTNSQRIIVKRLSKEVDKLIGN
jgi:hypothetical protein